MKLNIYIRISVAVVILATFGFILYLQNENPPENAEAVSGAYQALNFWSQQRAYPEDAMPDVGHYAAYLSSRSLPLDRANIMNNNEGWKAIGPHNLGGRTLAIAFNPQNPNTVFAGSASGGLWRSKTGGRGPDAWERLQTGFPILAVSCIEFAPADSGTIYIGTGEVYNYQAAGTGAAYRNTRGTYGIGILKSTDGGQTWSKSLDWSNNQMRGVWAVKINPLNINTVWAATTDGTYRSTDGGNTWAKVHSVVMANDLVIHSSDTSTIIVGCGNFASANFGIYRTTDSGANWTKKSGSGIPSTFYGKIQLAIAQSNPDIIYASIGNGFTSASGASWLCRSDDGGANWSLKSTVDYSQWQGWFSHDVAVNPVNPDEIFVIGIHIYKSSNGGASLVQVSSGNSYSGRIPPEGPEGPPTYSHVDHHDVRYHPTNPDIIYFGNDGGIFRTINSGASFESCNAGYQTAQFYNGFSSARTDSLLSMGGLQDNSTTIYDGQLAWFVRLIGGDGSWTAIDPLNSGVMYGSWQNLNMLRSNDGGQSFFYITPPGSQRFTSFIAPFVLAADMPQTIYAGRDIIYKSTNGGINWNATNNGVPLDGNPAIAMATSEQSSNVVYAATAPYQFSRGRIFHTSNGGVSWTDITGSLPDRFPSDLAVDPGNDAVVYLTLSGFGSSHIFKSTDSGNTWQDIGAGLPDVPANAVIVDPDFPGTIYLGNDIGVFASTDGGSNWINMSQDLPEALIVMDLSISPLNRKIRLASHGNGAYEHDLLDSSSAINGSGTVSRDFRLLQNYPNPFNPGTTIEYFLPRAAEVTLVVYNIRGEMVQVLEQGHRTAGKQTTSWDGKNQRGLPAASGIYFYRLKVGESEITRRMMLVR